MKKKNYDEDSDNEFDVDEPEELQEHSDEEWAPQVCVLSFLRCISCLFLCSLLLCFNSILEKGSL